MDVWSAKNRKIIEEHLLYHRKMVKYLEELRKHGFQDHPPKKTTSKLPSSSMQTDNHTKLAGIELHQYVEQFLVDETSNICEKPKEKCLNKMTD